jgi:hypothetical protein
MRLALVIAALAIASALRFTDSQTPAIQKPTIVAREVPPEAIPSGTCAQYESGYLENSDGHSHLTNYSAAQIGDYVDSRLKSGHIVTLYPQMSSKIFVIATCGN